MGSSAQRMRDDNKRARKNSKKGTLPKDQQFVQIINAFRKEPAWMALSFGARCLYIELKAEYNGSNNGRIMCSARYAAKALGCNKDSVTGYFRELQEYGFIVMTGGGVLGSDGRGTARCWRLTELGFMGDQPTREYKSWHPKKNKIPSQKLGQGVRKNRTACDNDVPKTRTGRPKNWDGYSAEPAPECPKNRDNLIYQGEGGAAHADTDGESLAAPRYSTSTSPIAPANPTRARAART